MVKFFQKNKRIQKGQEFVNRGEIQLVFVQISVLYNLYFQMNIQNQDQSIHKFLFKITPLQIIASKSNKNFKKSILIKLASKSQKTTKLNDPINIQVDVLYSKTLKKYCPIKGIIKIYDVGQDGSQVISSVGGFQTQQLLNQNKKQLLFQRDIGTSKLKMHIQIQNLSLNKPQLLKKQQEKSLKQNQNTNSQSSLKKQNTNSTKNIGTAQKQQEENNKVSSTTSLKRPSLANSNVNMTDTKQKYGIQLVKKQSQNSIQVKQIIKNYQSYNKNISQKKSESLSQSGYSQTTFRQKQFQQIGNQLLLERRLTKDLQDKISKLHAKNQVYKQKILASNKQLTLCVNFFKKIADNIQYKNGKVIIQINQKEKTLSLKYKNRVFQKIFTEFTEFMVTKINDSSMRITIDDQAEHTIGDKVSPTTHLALQKMQQQYNSLTEQLKKKTNQLFILRNKQRQFLNAQNKLKIKQKQIQDMQSKLKQSELLRKSLQQVNQYLKEKDGQMQLIIFNKQTSLQTYKQQVAELNITIKQMEASIQNDGLIIQQLRQEISNLSQSVEQYRQKYGDLKSIKNRALQNQLKQCLMWIDQQDKNIDIGFQEQTSASQKQKGSMLKEGLQYFKNLQMQSLQKYQKQQVRNFKEQLNRFSKKIQIFLKAK